MNVSEERYTGWCKNSFWSQVGCIKDLKPVNTSGRVDSKAPHLPHRVHIRAPSTRGWSYGVYIIHVRSRRKIWNVARVSGLRVATWVASARRKMLERRPWFPEWIPLIPNALIDLKTIFDISTSLEVNDRYDDQITQSDSSSGSTKWKIYFLIEFFHLLFQISFPLSFILNSAKLNSSNWPVTPCSS